LHSYCSPFFSVLWLLIHTILHHGFLSVLSSRRRSRRECSRTSQRPPIQREDQTTRRGRIRPSRLNIIAIPGIRDCLNCNRRGLGEGATSGSKGKDLDVAQFETNKRRTDLPSPHSFPTPSTRSSHRQEPPSQIHKPSISRSPWKAHPSQIKDLAEDVGSSLPQMSSALRS
jgi:hypothetical protein